MDVSERGQVGATEPRGQRAAAARQAAGAPKGSPAIAAAKRLALMVGLGVLVTFLGSCAAGYAIVQTGSGGVLASVRDVGLLILAPVYLLQAIFWAGVYFGLAWVVGAFGPRIPSALRWTAEKVARVEALTRQGSDRFVVRPLAATVRRATEARFLVSHLNTEVSTTATIPVRRWTRELSDWPTLQHRLRLGRTPLPATPLTESLAAGGDVARAPSPAAAPAGSAATEGVERER
jgi:hypothetical protein